MRGLFCVLGSRRFLRSELLPAWGGVSKKSGPIFFLTLWHSGTLALGVKMGTAGHSFSKTRVCDLFSVAPRRARRYARSLTHRTRAARPRCPPRRRVRTAPRARPRRVAETTRRRDTPRPPRPRKDRTSPRDRLPPGRVFPRRGPPRPARTRPERRHATSRRMCRRA